MRFRNHPIIWLSSAAVFVAGCTTAQSQGTPPGNVASQAATQGAIGPAGLLPRDLLYVGGGTEVDVYARRGSNEQKIGSIKKGVDFATGLAVDASENLYVGNEGKSSVTVYARGSKAPSETLTDAGAPYGVAVGHDGTVYAANRKRHASILVYPKGQTTPSQTIPIAKGSQPFGLALDSSGNLFATVNRRMGSTFRGAVYEFAPGSSKGKNLRLQGLTGELNGIATDAQNDLLVLAGDIFVFPPGKNRPSQKISTSGQGPLAIAIDAENTEVWITFLAGEVEGFSYPDGTLLDIVHHPALTTGVAVGQD